MENYNSSRGLIQQMLRTRMAFRQALQRVLKRNNIDITFEMLQVLSSLWQEQGISQQALAEKTAKDKACMTNLMANLEKKGWIMRQEDPNDRRNRLVYHSRRRRDIRACTPAHQGFLYPDGPTDGNREPKRMFQSTKDTL